MENSPWVSVIPYLPSFGRTNPTIPLVPLPLLFKVSPLSVVLLADRYLPHQAGDGWKPIPIDLFFCHWKLEFKQIQYMGQIGRILRSEYTGKLRKREYLWALFMPSCTTAQLLRDPFASKLASRRKGSRQLQVGSRLGKCILDRNAVPKIPYNYKLTHDASTHYANTGGRFA